MGFEGKKVQGSYDPGFKTASNLDFISFISFRKLMDKSERHRQSVSDLFCTEQQKDAHWPHLYKTADARLWENPCSWKGELGPERRRRLLVLSKHESCWTADPSPLVECGCEAATCLHQLCCKRKKDAVVKQEHVFFGYAVVKQQHMSSSAMLQRNLFADYMQQHIFIAAKEWSSIKWRLHFWYFTFDLLTAHYLWHSALPLSLLSNSQSPVMVEECRDNERRDGKHEGSVELKYHSSRTFVVNCWEDSLKDKTPRDGIGEGVIWNERR